MAYSSLPTIEENTRLIAFQSPFHKRPELYPTTIEEMAQIWLPEIRRRQPHGPYNLGGWSAGGYYASEAARLLISQGEVVEKVILIDSPCRPTYKALPIHTVRSLASKGLMGPPSKSVASKRRAPSWMLDHFAVTIRAMESYTPLPLPTAPNMPEVYIIWASEGVAGMNASEIDWTVDVNHLLLKKRRSFGPLGWDTLFPNVELKTAALPGAHHFNMVHGTHAVDLADLLRIVMNHRC